MNRPTIAIATRVTAVCLSALVAFGCVRRRPTPIETAAAPPPPAVEGTQSLEDLDRALQSGGAALVATIHRSERTTDKSATVKVIVSGFGLVDPDLVNEEPRTGQGHLHYQLDDGPVIATIATKLSFRDLPPGRHIVTVTMVGNDDAPVGPKRILTVGIPSDGKPPKSRATKHGSTKKPDPRKSGESSR